MTAIPRRGFLAILGAAAALSAGCQASTMAYFLFPEAKHEAEMKQLASEDKKEVRTLSIREIAILPRPTSVSGAEVASTIPLDEIAEGEHDWQFTRGEEFPGAKGSLSVVKDQPAKVDIKVGNP